MRGNPPAVGSSPIPVGERAAWTGLPVAILREVRPRQWLKNGLIFFGLVYSLQLGSPSLVARSLLAFGAFCLVSSAGYVFNDLRDLELDRRHPLKRHRPVASGHLPVPLARGLAVALLGGGLALAATLGAQFVGVALAYVLLTGGYSLWFKHVVLVDAFALSGGFVLRAAAGAVAIAVPISPWLYMCTLLGSLVISFGKRRSEIVEMQREAEEHRPALEHYTVGFLDNLIVVAATASVMAYSLYTFSAEHAPKSGLLMATIPIAIYGVFRFLYLVQVRGLGASPDELLLADRSLGIAVALFLAVSAAVLYLGR